MPDLSILEINGVPYEVRDPSKAPAGYGLGESFMPLVSGDPENLTKTGWYLYSRDVGDTNAPMHYGVIEAICADRHTILTAYPHGGDCFSVKMKHWGTWGEWDWVNPPMLLGTEYRTTERWNGKAVYAVLLNFGTMPSNDSKIVGSGIEATHTISCELSLEDSDGFSYTGSPAIDYYRATAHGTISMEIKTSYDYSSTAAYFLIKYIKD